MSEPKQPNASDASVGKDSSGRFEPNASDLRRSPNARRTVDRIAQTLGVPGSAFRGRTEVISHDDPNSAIAADGLSLMRYFFRVSDAEARRRIIAYARSAAENDGTDK